MKATDLYIDKEDWEYQKEFNEWFSVNGPNWDKEEDPEGERFIDVKYWSFKAYLAGRKKEKIK